MKLKVFRFLTTFFLILFFISSAYGQSDEGTPSYKWWQCRSPLGNSVSEQDVLKICGPQTYKIPVDVPITKPADLPFYVDCSEINPEKQAACNSFIVRTRDEVYPVLRNITGTSLSNCFNGIYYKILDHNPRAHAGGIAEGNHITYNERYSVDDPFPFDVHELIHTFAYCSGALDDHHFHATIQDVIYGRLYNLRTDPTSKAGTLESYFKFRYIPPSDSYNKSIISIKKGTNACRGIVGSMTAFCYLEYGEQALKKLYRSTSYPHPASPPNKKMREAFGPDAEKVQSLMEMLTKDYGYAFNDLPSECGFDIFRGSVSPALMNSAFSLLEAMESKTKKSWGSKPPVFVRVKTKPGVQCIALNPSMVQISESKGQMVIKAGANTILIFGQDAAGAARGLEIIQHYGFDQHCFWNDPEKGRHFEYFTVRNQIPQGGLPNDDCISFNPDRMYTKQSGSAWVITDGTRNLLRTGDDREAAEAFLKIIRSNRSTKMCYAGNQRRDMMYLRN